jgi:hypothetical protein
MPLAWIFFFFRNGETSFPHSCWHGYPFLRPSLYISLDTLL